MLKFLALGDSYTIGEGLPLESAWPWQLVKALRKKDLLIAAPEIIATTGWTTGELLQALSTAHIQPPYDLVTLLIGVNNQYRGQSLETYEQDFRNLQNKALALTDQKPERVIILSIPDWSYTPFAAERDTDLISAEIREYNRVNARLAYAREMPYINITELTLLARHAPNLLAEDQLHYSADMYKRWVDLLLPKVWRALMPGRNFHIPLLYQPEAEQP